MGLPPTPPQLPPPVPAPPTPPLPRKPTIHDLLDSLRKWRWPVATAVAIAVIATFVTIYWDGSYEAMVVNIIPAEIALDEDPNPEPSIAVNPANSNEIVAGGLWMGRRFGCPRTTFGVTYSVDRGQTWTLHCSLELGSEYAMGDPSFGFAHDGSALLVGAQATDAATRHMSVRLFSVKPSPDVTWPVTDLVDPGDPTLDWSHVPWVSAGQNGTSSFVAIGGDSYSTNTGDCNSGVVWWNYPTSTSYTAVCVSPRISGPSRYTPVVRTAVHTDGTAYAATYRIRQANTVSHYDHKTGFIDHTWGGALMDVVVLRHDPNEPSSLPTDAFSGLKEPPGGDPCDGSGDGLRGVRVVRCVPVPFEEIDAGFAGFGNERRLYSHVALAVDPSNSAHVFVAWGDTASTKGMTLHIRESTDGGKSWSPTDLYSTLTSINPALAVTTSGRLGFSYQQLAEHPGGKRWDTVVQIFDAGNVSAGPVSTFTLASMIASSPRPCTMPYIGDYMDLKAVDGSFYGVFSTSSDLTSSNFPQGVTYARALSVQQGTDACPRDSSLTPEVNIDPYFFRLDQSFSIKILSSITRSALKKFSHRLASGFK